MLKLDEVLDKKPRCEDVATMAELRIRNLQAFDELQSFNDSGKFLYRHPLLAAKSEYRLLKQLLHNNATEFLHQYKCTSDNVRRYKSYIQSKRRSDKRDSDINLLNRHQERLALFKQILEEHENLTNN